MESGKVVWEVEDWEAEQWWRNVGKGGAWRKWRNGGGRIKGEERCGVAGIKEVKEVKDVLIEG